MILKDILAISGQPGLFKFIAKGKNALIVEHLETKKRSSAFSSTKISSLDEISIFTEKEDVPLGKVFDLIHEKEKGGPAVDPKTDSDKLKAYFKEVLPEYSKERVYTSDIKKVLQWYNILQKLNLLVKEEPEKPAEAEEKKDSGKKKEAEGKKVPAPKKKLAEKKKATAPKKKVSTSEKSEPASKMKTSKPKGK
jgi:hypothetical protein